MEKKRALMRNEIVACPLWVPALPYLPVLWADNGNVAKRSPNAFVPPQLQVDYHLRTISSPTWLLKEEEAEAVVEAVVVEDLAAPRLPAVTTIHA